MKIKSGQTVKVLSGKDRGKTGKVIQVFPKLDKIVVDGVNQSFKHLKARGGQQSQKGERVEYFGPIHVSNVKQVEQKAEEKKTTKKTVKKEKSSTESKK